MFYQLLAGGEVYPELKTRLALKEADEYHYLNQSSVTTVENINDEKDYEELINAMDVLNMSRTERDDILTLVSAILHLGACLGRVRWFFVLARCTPPQQVGTTFFVLTVTASPLPCLCVLPAGDVEFETQTSATGDDGAKVKNMPVLALAASQLKVDAAALAKSLCYKNIGGSREVIFVNYTLAVASDSRDSLAKARTVGREGLGVWSWSWCGGAGWLCTWADSAFVWLV